MAEHAPRADVTRVAAVEREALAEALDSHDLCMDLGTPRQYTQHGNWNRRCSCGHPFGDDEEQVNREFVQHQADAILASGVLTDAAEVAARVRREVAEEEATRPVYLAYDGGSLWKVCRSRDAAETHLDDYMDRCWRGAHVIEGWHLATAPEATEPAWVRFYRAEGMAEHGFSQQRIEERVPRPAIARTATEGGEPS
jgi:hypothetical protein